MLEPITPEQTRFHAAGHLAGAVALVQANNIEGARTLLKIVRAYLDAPKVDNPPQFRETLDKAIADPSGELRHLVSLEAMFCHPANTQFENAGMRMGKGE